MTEPIEKTILWYGRSRQGGRMAIVNQRTFNQTIEAHPKYAHLTERVNHVSQFQSSGGVKGAQDLICEEGSPYDVIVLNGVSDNLMELIEESVIACEVRDITLEQVIVITSSKSLGETVTSLGMTLLPITRGDGYMEARGTLALLETLHRFYPAPTPTTE